MSTEIAILLVRSPDVCGGRLLINGTRMTVNQEEQPAVPMMVEVIGERCRLMVSRGRSRRDAPESYVSMAGRRPPL
jgi:hypothetical protein